MSDFLIIKTLDFCIPFYVKEIQNEKGGMNTLLYLHTTESDNDNESLFYKYSMQVTDTDIVFLKVSFFILR